MARARPIIALTLLLCIGCLDDEDNVPVLRQQQAAQIDLAGAPILAVAPIVGPGGEDLHDLLVHQLGRTHTVVDPRDTYHALYGADLGAASMAQRAALARRLGADAIVVAQLLDSDVTQHFSWDAADGLSTTYTRHVELSLRVAFQAVDASGRNLGAITLDESYVVPSRVSVNEAPTADEAYMESLFGPMDAMGMLYEGLARVRDAWDAACTPNTVRATVVLFAQHGEYRSGEAVRAARRGDWYLAAHWYSRALEMYHSQETTARLHYNRGVALLYAGYPRAAEEAFLDALDLNPSWRVQTLASEQLRVAQITEGMQ